MTKDTSHLTKTIPSLDGIRALSLLFVIVAHSGWGYIIPGGFGVTVFFFLSGFLITTLFIKEYNHYNSINIINFYLRRLLRLTPPLLITLAITYLLMFGGVVSGKFNWETLASQIFYFHNYYYLSVDELQTPHGLIILWSLSVEEHFYLIYPLLFTLILRPFKNHSLKCITLLIVIIFIWRYLRFFYFGDTLDTLYYSSDTRIDSILFGCSLALCNWQGVSKKIFSNNHISMLISLTIGFSLLLLSFLYRDPDFRAVYRFSLQGLALIPLFYYATTKPNYILFRPLNTKIMKRIGGYSYSMYLCHLVVSKALIEHHIDERYLLISTLIISMTYAAIIYTFIEFPIKKIRHKLRNHNINNPSI